MEAIRALCECTSDHVRRPFSGAIADYAAWRTIHSSHGHLVQTFRDAEGGPQVRYWCACNATYHEPASSALSGFAAWLKKHRKHGIRGDVS